MRTIRYTFTLIFVFLFFQAKPIPVTPYPVTFTQPDGTSITIKLHGDEYFSYKTTLDGYPLIKNNDGIYVYAKVDNEGKLKSTEIKAHEIGNRLQSEKQYLKEITPLSDLTRGSIRQGVLKSITDDSPPRPQPHLTQGSPKCLVILVNFTDMKFTIENPQQTFTRMLNEKGYAENGATGSVRDYFMDNSNEQFSPEFVVIGPFDLPENRYNYSRERYIDIYYYPNNVADMVSDACILAKESGFDFSEYDFNNDGYVDNISFIYAGHNKAEGGPSASIWPHRAGMRDPFTIHDGKRIYDYMCVSELKGASGSNQCGVGTFIHEFSHVLGLKDYYVTKSGSNHHTLNVWDIMDQGGYLNEGRTPPAHSAYSRFSLGWLQPEEIKEAERNVWLEPLTESNQALIITENGNHNLNASNPNPVEFFMLENRQKKGWDSYLPGHGLLITRIYYNKENWDSNTVNDVAGAMGIDIIEADEIASGNTLSGDTYPGTSNIYSYTPKLRSGKDIQKPLAFIRENEDIISFRFMVTDAPEVFADGDLKDFSTVQGTPSQSQSLTVRGRQLDSNIKISFETNNHYELKKEGDAESDWTKVLELTPNNESEVKDIKILIRYNPVEPSYDVIHSDNLNIESEDADPIKLSVSGKSTRQVYVAPPLANEATDINSGGFTANWNEVADASGYYLTMYHISDRISEITENFGQQPKLQRGWTTSSSSYTSAANQSGVAPPAIRLENDQDYIMTNEYVSSIVSLSFYLKSIASSGSVLIQGLMGDHWEEIDDIPVSIKTDAVKSYEFDNTKTYTTIKISYTKKSGDIALDDIKIGFSKTMEYVDDEEWVNINYKKFENLLSDNEYFYFVKASDKTLNEDGSIKYENITVSSNTINVRTKNGDVGLEDDYKKNNIIKILATSPGKINIFNSLGQKIKSIQPEELFSEMNNLPDNQLYIFQKNKIQIKIIK